MRFRHRTTPVFPIHRAVRWICAAALLELAACAPDAPTSPGRLGATVRSSSDVAATEQLLYDQPPVIGTNLFMGGRLEDDYAVDFVVPPGGKWRVSRVVVIGQGINPTNPNLGMFQINLARDNGSGQPGNLVTSTISRVPDAPADPCCLVDVFDYSRTIDHELVPGRYWITTRLTSGAEREFNPQYAATTALPALIGDGLFTPWGPVPDAAPYKDFAFQVYGTVESPVEAATNLLTTIGGFSLPDGTFTSLQAKLNAGLAALAAGNKSAACTAFQDLINATSAQSGKKLTEAQATIIIDEATRVRAIIGC